MTEAKEYLSNERFDLVLIHIGLPACSGFDLLGLLRNNGDSTTPVIIFSGQDFAPKIADQVNAVLVKSSTSNEKLVSTIQTCINQHKSAEK